VKEIGEIDTGIGTKTPGSAMTLAMEIQKLRAKNKALAKDYPGLRGDYP